MKFAAIPAAILALAGLGQVCTAAAVPLGLSRRSCPEASRFGNIVVSPTTVRAGDTIAISVDFTCGVNAFGIVPQFADYTIEVPANENNGFEEPIVLARRTVPAGALSDSFSTTIPHLGYFANADYNVKLGNIYFTNGTDGSPVLVVGQVWAPITIQV